MNRNSLCLIRGPGRSPRRCGNGYKQMTSSMERWPVGGNLTRPFCTGQLRGILPITAQVGYRSCDGHHINFRRSDTTLRPNALILEAEPSPHFCKEKHKQKYCIASHDLSPKVRRLKDPYVSAASSVPWPRKKACDWAGCVAPCAVST
jgi:hypothetical protein